MIGFCLAAGEGTRLAPLTRVTPKPLLAPAGRPLVDLAVEALQTAGAARVVVNAHHGADLLVTHLAGRAGVEVVIEPVLLGTGGGLVEAARLGLLGNGDDPVLVTAADHVVDPADLAALARFLERSGAPMVAGLVPAAAEPFGLRLEGSSLVRDPDGPWDSAGAYALRAGLLQDLQPGPATLVARVLDPILDRSELAGLPFQGPMADAGTLPRLLDVSAGLLTARWPYALPPGALFAGRGGSGTRGAGGVGSAGPAVGAAGARGSGGGRFPGPGARAGAGPPGLLWGPVFVGEGAEVDPRAVLAGPVVLDAGSRVEAGAVVTRAVVGPGAVVGAGARVVGSFLAPGASLPAHTSATAALVPGPARHQRSPTALASPARPATSTRPATSAHAGTWRPGAGSPGGGA